MPAARVGAIVLHYRLVGPAEAPVLAFANSLGTDFRIWDEVAERLAGAYRILTYDKRGHGLSGLGRRPMGSTITSATSPACWRICASSACRWSGCRSAA